MARATTLAAIVDLIGKAEDALIKNARQTDPLDRACTLRGVYYGTPWSVDYAVESARSVAGARIRNLGFLSYTGGNIPADPRPAFVGTSLFADLQASQSIHDARLGVGIDVGHLLIGLETRSSATMRTTELAGQGGTGLEIVTWLGDLGGGAASLAMHRATIPSTSVEGIFNNTTSDYGVTENLEGDVAGYLVAAGTAPGGGPLYTSGKGVSDAMADYLPIASSAQWVTRAARFATALGATTSAKGITNKADVVDRLTQKLYDFAVWYAVTRWIPSGELLGKTAVAACSHMRGAAREVATVFVSTVSATISSPRSAMKSAPPYPAATAAGTCDSKLMNAASVDVSAIRQQLESWRQDLGTLFQ